MQITTPIHTVPRGPMRRHEARVRRFSTDYALLERLDTLAIGDVGATSLIEEVCWSAGVEAPRLKFHARRSMYTGATERPRSAWVAVHGEVDVARHERATGKLLPLFGAIRLGRTATLMTIAHELGHHLVFALDPQDTPAHGKVWIGRFDAAASAVAAILDV